MNKIEGHIMAIAGVIGVIFSPYAVGLLVDSKQSVLCCWATGMGVYVLLAFFVLVYMFLYDVFKDK